nr:lantibiotic dehydratase family protein [Allomuricauda sp.]
MELSKRYKLKENYILRTPLYPIEWSERLTSFKDVPDEAILNLLNDALFKKAIKIASKNLHDRLILWQEDKIKDSDQINRLKLAVIKYAIRISTRCTPFGIFAGCSTGQFSEQSNIRIKGASGHRLCARVNYANLFEEVMANDLPIDNHYIYANGSLYRFGDSWRYLERHLKKGKFSYTTEEVKCSEILDLVISISKKGITFPRLLRILREKDIEQDDARNYIDELIQHHIIGYQGHPKLIQEVFEYDEFNLTDNRLDPYIDNSDRYQFDLFVSTKTNKLHSGIKKEVFKVLELFQKMSPIRKNEKLETFKKELKKRYGDKEVSLPRILDPEYGIDYLKSHSFIGDVQLLDKLNITPRRSKGHINLELNRFQMLLNTKILEAKRNNAIEIRLHDHEFSGFDTDPNQLPNSLFGSIELVGKANDRKIYIGSFIGKSAARIIARFGYGDAKIQGIINTIVEDEHSNVTDDEVLAEIVHLPSPKSGNISRRTIKRGYEIPYLGNSDAPIENQLHVDDLRVSVKNDRLVLSSKSIHKSILPILTNMHNYAASPLPVYQFLCDFIEDRQKKSYGFNWGSLESIHSFLPRVSYGNLILQKAKWTTKAKDIPGLHQGINAKEFERWRNINQIPSKISIVEGDNKLLLNLHNKQCLEILARMAKKTKWLEMEEFLFEANPWVLDENQNSYSNEVIVFLNKVYG